MIASAEISGVKVIHVRASNFFGGPEKQIMHHLLLLKRNNIEALVCSFQERGGETELVALSRRSGLRSVSIECSNAYDVRQIFRLRKLFLAENPHVVCTHDYRSNLLTHLAKRGLKIAHVAFWRGITRENLKVRLYHLMERRLLKSADHVVVVSEEQRHLLTSGALPGEKISVVPNAVDVRPKAGEGFHDSGKERSASSDSDEVANVIPASEVDVRVALLSELSGKTIIATAGRLSPEKGHRHLLKALALVLRDRPDVHLVVFGGGPLRTELTHLAGELGCSKSIHFLGFVPDFASLLDGIDIFVLPSLSEGLPNALLEAMAAGKPVVATAIGGVPNLVEDGVTGLLVSPGESKEMASALGRLLSDSNLAAELGSRAQEAVRRSHSFERQYQLLIEVYARVASGPKRGANGRNGRMTGQ
jgi:glycosyltransferase involved in cell wall biosynthesis